MKSASKLERNCSHEAGIGLMEAIIAVLVAVIIGFVLFQLVRQTIASYKLNEATSSISETLGKARDLATSKHDRVKVIFDAVRSRFGMDKNNNGKLDSIEAVELPSGIGLSEDAVVIFTRSGSLAKESKRPRISVSNDANSRTLSISPMGNVEIE